MSVVATFLAKLGTVLHHNVQATGNETTIAQHVTGGESPRLVGYERYYRNRAGVSVSAGWQNINIGRSDNQKRLRVKFYADNTEFVDRYSWNFGDGSTAVTISPEVVHTYDLLKKSQWLTNSGILPIQGLTRFTGNWTNVTLTAHAVRYNGVGQNGLDTVNTVQACVYEITGELYGLLNDSYSAVASENIFQDNYDTATFLQNNN